ALDVLWIVPVIPGESYLLSAVVRQVPADLETWLATRGRVLQVSQFEHPVVDLQYLPVDHTFDEAAANELAAAWGARRYAAKPPPPPPAQTET
ncbi:hypothetical protein ABTH50_19725, partial [Acinetobacter baumannii]